MAEYRLAELATLSTVSVRNIRAYRERGLLDPPRREGRSALYDDRHLAQLKMIGELLRRGFTSAHIAEFFAGMRRGQDLADLLGLQQTTFGTSRQPSDVSVRVLADGSAGGRLALADDVEGEVLVAPRLTELPVDHRRVILRVSDGITGLLDDVADAVVRALEDSVLERFGPNYVARAENVDELREILSDYRDLGSRVVADHFDAALRRHLVVVATKHSVDAAPGNRGPANSGPANTRPADS